MNKLNILAIIAVVILALVLVFIPRYLDKTALPEESAAVDQLEYPGSVDGPEARDGCVVTGCSGQICAAAEVITTCLFLPEYACYRSAICERQADGACGWTPTDEFNECLEAYAR